MNERFKLDSETVRNWLTKEGRSQTWLARELKVSGSLVDKMLGGGHVPKQRTLDALAALMGKQGNDLLIPRGPTAASA